MSAQSLHIVYAFFGTYPNGPAAAKHIQLLCRGMQASGALCTVLALSPEKSSADTTVFYDKYGIKVYNIPHPLLGRGNFHKVVEFTRCQSKFRDIFGKLAAAGAIAGLILYYDVSAIFAPLRRLARDLKIPVIGDCNEDHSLHFGWIGKYHFWDQLLVRKCLMRRLDAILGISSYWHGVARRFGIDCICVPAVGDSEEPPFPPPVAAKGKPFTLGYVGALAERDLPIAMLKAFEKAVRHVSKDLRLDLIGAPHAQRPARRVMEYIDSSGALRGRVRVLGRLSTPEFAHACHELDAFIFLRADSTEVRACFPTRLPEQLLSGRPVLISNVGDIKQFLRHEENALLIPPGLEEPEVPAALKLLLNRFDFGRSLGMAGRQTALTQMCYRWHGRRLSEFVASLALPRSSIGASLAFSK